MRCCCILCVCFGICLFLFLLLMLLPATLCFLVGIFRLGIFFLCGCVPAQVGTYILSVISYFYWPANGSFAFLAFVLGDFLSRYFLAVWVVFEVVCLPDRRSECFYIVCVCIVGAAPHLACHILGFSALFGILTLVLLSVPGLLCLVPDRLASLDAWLQVSLFPLSAFLVDFASSFPSSGVFCCACSRMTWFLIFHFACSFSLYYHHITLFRMYCFCVLRLREHRRNMRLVQTGFRRRLFLFL